MSGILNLVSLSRKAGKLEAGDEPVSAAARARQARLILVAKDASENTYRRVRHLGESCNVIWVSVPYTKAELGQAIGRGETAMAAVTDIGLAASVIRGLAQDDPEKYAIPLEKLTVKNEKAQRRLQEKRQHEKNLRSGKYRAKQNARKSGSDDGMKRKPDGERKPKSASAVHGSEYGNPARKRHTDSAQHAKTYRPVKKGRSNRYEEYGPTGKPGAGHRKSRET